jgi:hypothetical protein
MKITQTENPVVELVRNGKNKIVTGLALELSDALNGAIAQAKEREFPKSRTDKMYEEGRDEIGRRLFEAVDARAQAIRDEFAKAENSYADDNARHINRKVAELAIAQNRYDAMGVGELNSELENIATGEFITVDPNFVDALFTAARTAGVDVNAYRELVIEKNYRSPWLQDPEGKALNDELKMSESCKGFDFPCVFDGEGVTMFSVDDLLEGVE